VDVWAVGILLYMLISGGQHPFLTAGGNLDKRALVKGSLDFGFKLGQLVGWAPKFSEAAQELCQRLMEPDPKKRLTVKQALKDPWLHKSASVGREVSREWSISVDSSIPVSIPELTGPAKEHFVSLQQQLIAAEREVRAAEEREVSLLHQLARRDDSAPGIDCRTGCGSVSTSCTTERGQRWIPWLSCEVKTNSPRVKIREQITVD